jgi:hypothetical protein
MHVCQTLHGAIMCGVHKAPCTPDTSLVQTPLSDVCTHAVSSPQDTLILMVQVV